MLAKSDWIGQFAPTARRAKMSGQPRDRYAKRLRNAGASCFPTALTVCAMPYVLPRVSGDLPTRP
jgi:hypothetical protein